MRDIVRWHLEGHLLTLFLRPDARGVRSVAVADTVLPEGWIDRGWICYCAGMGEEIRIETWLSDHIGANVWAFDPTPRAIKFMEGARYDRSRLHFMPVGLWSEDKVLRFYAPPDPLWVSHSVMGEQGGGSYFDAPCRSLPSLMQSLGHDRIDLLKMNIEGAEHVVLGSALQAGILPATITLTYEGSYALLKARSWTKKLRDHGYRLLGRNDWWVTYVREGGGPQRLGEGVAPEESRT